MRPKAALVLPCLIAGRPSDAIETAPKLWRLEKSYVDLLWTGRLVFGIDPRQKQRQPNFNRKPHQPHQRSQATGKFRHFEDSPSALQEPKVDALHRQRNAVFPTYLTAMASCKGARRHAIGILEALGVQRRPTPLLLPQPFLCPRLFRPVRYLQTAAAAESSLGEDRFADSALVESLQTDGEALQAPVSQKPNTSANVPSIIPKLPLVCPGCGALSQTTNANQPGYYSRRAIKSTGKYVSNYERQASSAIEKARVFHSPEILRQLGIDPEEPSQGPSPAVSPPRRQEPPDPPTPLETSHPICNRCHSLMHHNVTNLQIPHASLPSLSETIDDSPHDRNHIYHILDAVDFPMTLLPNLPSELLIAPLRSKNRRSKPLKYKKSSLLPALSFVITRSDLLSNKKEQVDRMMPVIVEILRDALGRKYSDRVRLGNVYCVSAKRGWWTKELKEDIYERGGGNWFVGAVNVGKSALFRAAFPKGRMQLSSPVKSGRSLKPPSPPQEPNIDALMSQRQLPQPPTQSALLIPQYEVLRLRHNEELLASDSLLPPAPFETQYPVLPLDSPYPGTTVSPIRVPFGSGKGELIDLPGLQRTHTFDPYVNSEAAGKLLMKTRVMPQQYTLKGNRQSLLLGGGLIRITPITSGAPNSSSSVPHALLGQDDTAPPPAEPVFLLYPFVPDVLPPHQTSTTKAALAESFPDEQILNVPSIVTPSGRAALRSAGIFSLRHDVTKLRAGPLTRRDDVGLSTSRLHFRVFSTELLIAGLGWVEIVCQVRRGRRAVNGRGEEGIVQYDAREEGVDGFEFPRVEVFSPEGKGVGERKPLQCFEMRKMRMKPRGRVEEPRPRVSGQYD